MVIRPHVSTTPAAGGTPAAMTETFAPRRDETAPSPKRSAAAAIRAAAICRRRDPRRRDPRRRDPRRRDPPQAALRPRTRR